MPLRLLLAVLMLIGPIPVRVCTCAASQPFAPLPAFPPQGDHSHKASHESESTGCKCKPKPRDKGAAPASVKQIGDVEIRGSEGVSPPAPVRHHRDCPAVNPSPTVVAAIPASSAEFPEAVDLGFPLRVEPFVVAPPQGRFSPVGSGKPTRSFPLYLTLLTLRI